MTEPPVLLNPFVGREHEQQVYRQLLAQHSPWVMIVTAPGGIGKSRLLRRLKERTPAEYPVVTLDFASEEQRSDAFTVLQRISRQSARYCDSQRVEAFNAALKAARGSIDEMIRQSRNTSQTLNVGDQSTVSGIDMTSAVAGTLRELEYQERAIVTDMLYGQLDTYHPSQLILMLDTCEWLSEKEALTFGSWVMDALLPGIHERLQEQDCRCFAVITSREAPKLPAIEKSDCRHLKLPLLGKAETESYLEQIGMRNAALRERVYEITRGHALCLYIMGALIQDQVDHPLTLADLPKLRGDFNERALIEYVRERLESRLKTPYKELARYSVLLRSFNLPMLRAVFPELLPASDDEADEIFARFPRYIPLETVVNGRYAVHNLLREIWAAHVREQLPEAWHKYHQRALDYLTQKEPDSPDWYYHKIAIDEDEGMDGWWDAMINLKNYAANTLTVLCDTAFDVTLHLSPQQDANRTFQLGRVQQLLDQYDDALTSYAEALRLFQLVGDRLGEANVRKAIGDVQRFRDQYDDALTSYAEALRLFQLVGSRLGEANVLQAIGDVHQFRKQLDDALTSYAEALRLFQLVGSRLGEANCYLAQGQVALQRENYEQALELHDRAYQLYRDIGDRYSQARLLYFRSVVFEAMDKREQAIQDMEKAVAIAETLDLPFIDMFRRRLDELRGES